MSASALRPAGRAYAEASFPEGEPRATTALQLDPRFRLRGRAALRELCRHYLRLLWPSAVLALTVFCSIWVTVQVFLFGVCKDSLYDNRGTATAATDCINPAWPVDYSKEPRFKKYFILTYWCVENTWTILYGPILGYAMFPGSFTHTSNLIIMLLVLTCFLFPFIASQKWGLGLQTTPFMLFYAFLGQGSFFSVATTVSRYTKNWVDGWRWVVLWESTAGAVPIYQLLLPLAISKNTTPEQYLLLRLVIHPIVWGAVTMMFTHTARRIGEVPNLMQATLWIFPTIYNGIYGRFLLGQLGHSGSIIMLNIFMALFSVVNHLAMRPGSTTILRITYGARTAEAIAASSTVNQVQVAERFALMLSEYSGILTAGILYSYGRLEGLGTFREVWVLCGWQTATQLVADFLTMGFDWKYHNIDFFTHWIKNMPRFLLYGFLIMFIGLSRVAALIMSLFCPSYDAAGNLSMVYCNTPGLFNMIGKYT